MASLELSKGLSRAQGGDVGTSYVESLESGRGTLSVAGEVFAVGGERSSVWDGKGLLFSVLSAGEGVAVVAKCVSVTCDLSLLVGGITFTYECSSLSESTSVSELAENGLVN